MRQWIKQLAKGSNRAKDLTYDDAWSAAHSIFNGEATDVQLAAFLIAQRIKKESPEEVAAFVHFLRERAMTIPLPEQITSQLIDFSGPYDGRKTFAVTVPVSILLAESGMPVYLHSSDTLPPKRGSTLKAIFEQLQIPVQSTAEDIATSIKEYNIGFGWTESLCQPLSKIRHVREQIEVRSFINIVEKLLNLSHAQSIMLGIFHKSVLNTNVTSIRNLGFKKAYIVQGAEGSEDMPIHRKSFVYEVTKEEVNHIELDPQSYGLHEAKDDQKESLTLQDQVKLMEAILHGEEAEELTYFRKQVIYNAAARYYFYGNAASMEEGIERVIEQLKNKRGAHHLDKWRQSFRSTK
ncbi:anthranilate phosphoribosyltransferase [Evansella cellulosilytica]|uniref:Anthranilate phosphoribosyltransferase n=1 Tax=Evansella cellulosilytica (strain ATCC 21833 / DSM 2522 / FERM P-1141 / JCM 9156 / N-4) TaxID=649639 RepID=E6U1A4_EVAC2|nr:glycosyl transferase [Evansella cellulosilytica]ADU29151.1 Anthranilate phosphoribosyltransferase [Evansella cellulosilytica DSM 2522]